MSSTNPRPDNYWGSCSGFAGDQPVNDPPLWVPLAAAFVIVAGVFAFCLWRDEFAPSAADVVEVQP